MRSSVQNLFKGEYLIDYLKLTDSEDEKEIENRIVTNIRDFILRMGIGFSFIGNQYRIELAGDEFFVDLLFFNRTLQCLIAIELKKGKFKPAYAGQLNFYLNLLDDKVRLPHERPSIGIVLCKEKNNTVVEYAVRNMGKAIGVASFKISQTVPSEIKRVLPDYEKLGEMMG